MPDPPLLRGRHEIGRTEIASLLTSHNLLCSSLRFSCLPKEHFYCPFLSVELLFILWDSTQMLPPPWSTAPPQWMNCLFLKSLTDPRSHVLLQQAQILLKRHLPVISYVTLGNNSFLDICFSICKMGIIVSALREIWGNLNCITHVRQRQNIKYIYSWCKYLLWASWREKRFCGDGCCFV